MNRNEMEYADAKASIVELVTKHALGACKIPEEWKPIVTEIVSNHILILMNTLGNIELIYRRSMMHFKELEELELNKTSGPAKLVRNQPSGYPND